MGLTIATPSAAIGPRLYAADFANNRIDIVNGQWQLVNAPGAFVDPNLPAGYGAYGIQTVGNRIIVTYARARLPRASASARARGSASSTRSTSTATSSRASPSPGGVLNAPWGTALAPANFGFFGGDLLIGNFGDGRINAFRENADGTWTSRGPLKGNNGQPLFIGGLWALQFGKGTAANGALDQLFFTAGPNGERAGLFGRLTSNLNEGLADVSGTVPATLSLTMGPAAAFGTFMPAVANDYNGVDHRQRHHVLAGLDAERGRPEPVRDRSPDQRHVLARAAAPDRGDQRRRHRCRVRTIGGSSAPTSLLTYPGPISQRHGDAELPAADRGHRPAPHGPVRKTLTFTLSTTQP